MTRTVFNFLTLISSALFYLINRFWLIPCTDGSLHWFLRCYANDLCAGAVMLAWLDLLLCWGHLPALSSLKATFPFLLVCGFFWEVLSPLWKTTAVFDPWDFLAYQIGGIVWLFLIKRKYPA